MRVTTGKNGFPLRLLAFVLVEIDDDFTGQVQFGGRMSGFHGGAGFTWVEIEVRNEGCETISTYCRGLSTNWTGAGRSD
jgi:hypothetical protein